jgi:hypothetical protein
MRNGRPLDTGTGSQGDSLSTAQGILRDALGALRNLAELLRSPRVAPKALSAVLPDVVDAFAPMREATVTLLRALGDAPVLGPGRSALEEFLLPRLSVLEEVLREAAPKPMSAASRLRLETIVGTSSFELGAARELLQILEHSASGRSTSVNPSELVHEAFATPPSVRNSERESVCAVLLASQTEGIEIDANPRVAMALVALGVELVSELPRPGEPTLWIQADRQGRCTIEVALRPHATGEPLVLVPRGVIEPTPICLRAAARMGGAELDWDAREGSFRLRYSPRAGSRSGLLG